MSMAKMNYTKYRTRELNETFQDEVAKSKKRQLMESRYNRCCYKCKNSFFKIKGFIHFDNGYCSEKCYVFRSV